MLTLTAAGTVDDYSDAKKASIASTLAAEAGVSVDVVSVSVEAASVIVTARIQATDETQSTSIATALSARLSSADAATSFLGIQVESTLNLTSTLTFALALT